MNLLTQAKNIALFTHINPDPDALGSVGALAYALEQMGKKCNIFLLDKPEAKFDFFAFPNVKYVWEEGYDLLVALDVSDPKRLGIFEQPFLAHGNTFCVDHHAGRNTVAKQEMVEPEASSTCEMLFGLLEQMQVKLSPEIANCLYLGIAGDTGNFMYSSTTAKTHQIAAALHEAGADFVAINQKIFMTRTPFELSMMQTVIERLEKVDHIGISYVLEKDKKNKDEGFNTSELVNIVKSVKGVEIAALIKQVKGKNYTISLRSTANYDVAAFATRFGGGGHKRASGMSLVGSLAQVKRILIKELKTLGH